MKQKKLCIVSWDLPDEMKKDLADTFCVYSLPRDSLLDSPVAFHPDMILSVIGNSIIIPRSYYTANRKLIDEIAHHSNHNIVTSDAPRTAVYPADVGMNVAIGNGFIICRPESTAPEILDAAKKAGLELIPVKQGYAGCSCIVTDKAVLTSDEGIHKELTAREIASFYVNKAGISLPGYDVGFIGGCGGFSDGVLYFFGSLDSVECGWDVRHFARTHGFEVRELTGEKLTDYGGMKIL